MATPPSSPPPSPPHPPTGAASQSPSTLKSTRNATRLRSLATRLVGTERPLVHVDPATGKADGPHNKKLRTYLGIVTRDKVDVTYKNKKQVPDAQKDLIWEDIQDVPKKAQAIQKQNTALLVLSRRGYEYLEKKMMDEKTKKKLEEAAQTGSIDTVIDPSSSIRQHVKWKMARIKKIGQMTSEAAKQIADKIDSLEEQASQGSFVTHGRQDMQSQFQSQRQSQGLALPPEPEVGPSVACVSIKESCVDPLGNDLDTVKFGIEEVKDADAPIPIPTEEVKLVGHALNTFLAWPTNLVKRLSEQGAVGPTKSADRPDHEVDDPLYLMTLIIQQLFLKPLQVMWDATVFGVFNEDFPLYIKHEDLSEIAHSGQCLSISVI
ncbi:hypothetical protein GmHk_15G044759 [Glycine max]|nr:hypothetical protein GmHk_15G044759 [Glycine max]KAH1210459.1 hypothetical protein GmHk_15G044759 [Glycine max]